MKKTFLIYRDIDAPPVGDKPRMIRQFHTKYDRAFSMDANDAVKYRTSQVADSAIKSLCINECRVLTLLQR